MILGDLSKDVMESLALAVLSPGVPTDLPVVEEMKDVTDTDLGRSRTGVCLWKRGCTGNYGNQRKDHNDLFAWRDHESIQRQRVCGGKYRKSVYGCSAFHGQRRFRCGGRDEQLPVGNNPQFCTESQCDLKHHTGSSESSSYDGSIYCGERKHYSESDEGRYLCAEL